MPAGSNVMWVTLRKRAANKADLRNQADRKLCRWRCKVRTMAGPMARIAQLSLGPLYDDRIKRDPRGGPSESRNW